MSQLYAYISTLPPHLSPLGHHRAPSSTPSVLQWVSTSCLFHTWWCIHVKLNLQNQPTLSSPFPCPHIHSLCLYLYSHPGTRFICTIFRGYIYLLILKFAQSSLILCVPTHCTVHGILQARILEWVAFPFSRGPSQPRGWIHISLTAGGFFTSWATRKAREYWSGQPAPIPGEQRSNERWSVQNLEFVLQGEVNQKNRYHLIWTEVHLCDKLSVHPHL